jgi:hypothetical protein
MNFDDLASFSFEASALDRSWSRHLPRHNTTRARKTFVGVRWQREIRAAAKA